jgi:hypothetical protein
MRNKALLMQQGQAAAEYLILCAVFALALGVGLVDEQSVLRQLLNGFAQAYQQISYAMALP